jgi:predicted dinucleotide-binding enzyme
MYRRSIMSYAIVGFGKIGQALAHAFARKNIDVTVASRRPPDGQWIDSCQSNAELLPALRGFG